MSDFCRARACVCVGVFVFFFLFSIDRANRLANEQTCVCVLLFLPFCVVFFMPTEESLLAMTTNPSLTLFSV